MAVFVTSTMLTVCSGVRILSRATTLPPSRERAATGRSTCAHRHV